MSLAMNSYPQHPPSHPHSHAHVQHSHHQPDAHQHSPQGHFSISRVPEDRYPLNAVRHSSRDISYTSQSTSYSDHNRYSRHLMQSQPERRSNSPYHHMMNVPQVQQAPLPPPHGPMHDPNARPPPGVPAYDFPSEYPPPGPGPSEFHHAPPMYRAEVNPVSAPPPAPMPAQPTPTHNSRPLNNSKRAEQNRKAQRAFRERRDQHVKQLESRSAMLDVALANADEANRRLEDSRILVEQLRAENQALRNALSAYVPQHGHPHSQLMIQTVPIPGLIHQPPGQQIPQAEAAPAPQGQSTPAQPPVPALDPSLPSQTQNSTQDSVSAPLNSGMDNLALGYPPRAENQPESTERRSDTPAQASSPATQSATQETSTETEKPAGDA